MLEKRTDVQIAGLAIAACLLLSACSTTAKIGSWLTGKDGRPAGEAVILGAPDALGLDRSLFALLAPEPIRHALELLQGWWEQLGAG